MQKSDIIVIGAGAAGMMCAWQAALRGRSVRVIEHTRKIGEKIRISGGGRSNFTNLYCSPDNFLSQNPHFCKSALRRFDQHDFIAMIEDHNIAYHEKAYDEKSGNQNARGQLFCDDSAQDIISMLRDGIENAGGVFQLETKVKNVEKSDEGYTLSTDKGDFACESLVIACGGLSIPKIGASNFGYELAKTFCLNIIAPRAGLVPLTFDADLLAVTKELSGVSVDAHVSCGDGAFREGLLFTHRGLSGPSILQVSSYWREGETVCVNLAPEHDAFEMLKSARRDQPKKVLRTILSSILPARIATMVAGLSECDTRIADLSDKKLRTVADIINKWACKPNGSEGYRTAEVTLGGVNTDEISSKTFEAKKADGLYFIGEVLDVTGHLGGHNFQWAWSSGWCCGQVV
ncbi:MAG: aminoacetone oxidase family FAD-binding enzyme [Alphaproteobacteria bacterium]|nr:MAG: aminoacetone oxidase family FAD-binding enzyme [Alphaproteobacteria bacterium]